MRRASGEERLKRLELSTFCMASRRSSQLSYSRVRRQSSEGLGWNAFLICGASLRPLAATQPKDGAPSASSHSGSGWSSSYAARPSQVAAADGPGIRPPSSQPMRSATPARRSSAHGTPTSSVVMEKPPTSATAAATETRSGSSTVHHRGTISPKPRWTTANAASNGSHGSSPIARSNAMATAPTARA
jgi:hypothetical protein